MTRKEDLVKEYDSLDKDLAELRRRLDDMRSSAPTKDSLKEFDLLRSKSKSIENRMSEIVIQITQLLKEEP